ncbi:MAG: hypothetical protein HY738_16325, partial [Bacteroidia bacterium]|nr:hypothetical protein [Bacteroidia bacterium]
IKFPKGKKYEKEWKKVDSLDNLALPKSALEVVNEIYKQSVAENNPEQTIKAFIFRMKYINATEESAFESLLKQLEADIPNAKFPVKAIMHSMLAQMYWMYYQNNSWRFYQRTTTINYQSDDIKTWTLDKLADKAIKHFRLSLENADSLQRTHLTIFEEIIQPGNQPANLRPTLYDFLAHWAIDFFSDTQLSLTRPADKFELKENFYFDEAAKFAALNINTDDTLSIHFYAVKTFQELLKFRLQNNNTDALIDADLKRLSFVYKQSVNDIKDMLYLSAIQALQNKYQNVPFSSEISYLIAKYYSNRASKYNTLQPETSVYKWDLKTANEICIQVINKFPETNAAEKCKNLQTEIIQHDLQVSMESYIEPSKVFTANLSYRNIQTAYIRIASIDRDKLNKITWKVYGYELLDKLLNESVKISETSLALPDDSDFNKHSLDFLNNGLPIGTYVLFVANNPKFSYEKNIVTYNIFNVTSISYIQRQTDTGSYEFTVFDRTSGVPLPGVSAQLYYRKYDYSDREYKDVKGNRYFTDNDGYISIPASAQSDYYSYYIEFSKNGDYLNTNQNYYSYHRETETKVVYNTYFFADRAIYRPGQTIYFKGIVIESDGVHKKIAAGFNTEVTLYDVNYQVVSALNLTSNEYGTFSGTFQLPSGLLNGQMHIGDKYGSLYFSVEDYKRPKFEVELSPFEGNYMLNDTVEVKGFAKSYSGSFITDANVTYRIIRTPIWRGWWWWDIPYSNVEIANGLTASDEKGEFKIKFKAVPDLSLKKNNKLSFNYEISIDVTDINGETQSTSGNITVGYTALDVNIEIAEKINKTVPAKFEIETKNLNGRFIPAKGKITISRLITPDAPLRERQGYMNHPDKFLYSKEEWNNKYPCNVYDNETDPLQMKKGEKVLETDFNTGIEKNLIIGDLKNWKSGRYIAEISSSDIFGNVIDNRIYFILYGTDDSTVPYLCNDWFTVLDNVCEPGETAKYLLGSALENVKVLYEIEHKKEMACSFK